jgi:polysaccharide biosynthesis transport protein
MSMSRHAEIFPQAGGVAGRPAVILQNQTDNPDSQAQRVSLGMNDAVRKLVQSVFRIGQGEKNPRVVAFCGVNRGAGSSWLCVAAAESLARQALGSVCLIDANLRTPSLHARFEADPPLGLAELLRTSRPVADFVQRTCESNLWLVAAGSRPAETNGSLNAQRLNLRFTELRQKFDFLLIDTPAVDLCPDAILLGQIADGVVLVVGSDSTRREAARKAKASFETAQVPVLGAVLNKRTFPIPEAIYRRI